MNPDLIQHRVIKIASQVFDLPEKQVHLGTQLGDTTLDSFAVVELIVAVQDEFGIHIANEQLQSLHTLQDLVWFIEKNSKKE